MFRSQFTFPLMLAAVLCRAPVRADENGAERQQQQLNVVFILADDKSQFCSRECVAFPKFKHLF